MVQAPLKKTHTLKQRITSGFVRGQPAQFQNVNFLVHTPIHKWQTAGKKLVTSHEIEALQDKQKLQRKTFSELAER